MPVQLTLVLKASPMYNPYLRERDGTEPVKGFDQNAQRSSFLLGEGERMEMKTSFKGEIPVLSISGRIIGESASAMKREMDKLIKQSKGRLILDLSEVPLLDSSALGAIVATLTSVKKMGGNLVLFNPQKAVQKVLEITRLVSIFEIYDELEVAAASFDR
ncbi:TPA: anti-sigma factor antagonist [Candidatus Poribacteria bacterium]|nr:anti-sigma factor antagonist [Candidatus Poribacteria bacterium]